MTKQMFRDVARQIELSFPEAPRQPLRLIAFAAVLFASTCVGGCVLDWEVPDATVETPAAFRAARPKNILAVLLAVPPESVDFKGGSLTHLHFPELKPGLPSELLLRRPDIAAAEASLVSQQFSVLQARAAFFPSIQLTGLYGVQSVALKTLFRPEAIF